MNRLILYLIILVAATGCYQRDVVYPVAPPEKLVPVKIELLWAARPQLPLGFYACFYPLEARPFVDFLDPLGGVLQLNPARYSMLIFNNDTEKVRYRNTTSFADFEAYVAPVERPSWVAGEPPEQGIGEPDRLFVAAVPEIEVHSTDDTVYVQQSPVRFFSVYPFSVQGIKGIEHLTAIRASVSGMAPWVRLATGTLGTPAATVFVNVRSTADGLEGGFSTFGHYDDPAVAHIVTLEMVYQGRLETRTYDVTQMLHQTGRIDIVETLDFPPVEAGGGFDTGVGGWDNDTINIPIQFIKQRSL